MGGEKHGRKGKGGGKYPQPSYSQMTPSPAESGWGPSQSQQSSQPSQQSQPVTSGTGHPGHSGGGFFGGKGKGKRGYNGNKGGGKFSRSSSQGFGFQATQPQQLPLQPSVFQQQKGGKGFSGAGFVVTQQPSQVPQMQQLPQPPQSLPFSQDITAVVPKHGRKGKGGGKYPQPSYSQMTPSPAESGWGPSRSQQSSQPSQQSQPVTSGTGHPGHSGGGFFGGKGKGKRGYNGNKGGGKFSRSSSQGFGFQATQPQQLPLQPSVFQQQKGGKGFSGAGFVVTQQPSQVPQMQQLPQPPQKHDDSETETESDNASTMSEEPPQSLPFSQDITAVVPPMPTSQPKVTTAAPAIPAKPLIAVMPVLTKVVQAQPAVVPSVSAAPAKPATPPAKKVAAKKATPKPASALSTSDELSIPTRVASSGSKDSSLKNSNTKEKIKLHELKATEVSLLKVNKTYHSEAELSLRDLVELQQQSWLATADEKIKARKDSLDGLDSPFMCEITKFTDQACVVDIIENTAVDVDERTVFDIIKEGAVDLFKSAAADVNKMTVLDIIIKVVVAINTGTVGDSELAIKIIKRATFDIIRRRFVHLIEIAADDVNEKTVLGIIKKGAVGFFKNADVDICTGGTFYFIKKTALGIIGRGAVDLIKNAAVDVNKKTAVDVNKKTAADVNKKTAADVNKKTAVDVNKKTAAGFKKKIAVDFVLWGSFAVIIVIIIASCLALVNIMYQRQPTIEPTIEIPEKVIVPNSFIFFCFIFCFIFGYFFFFLFSKYPKFFFFGFFLYFFFWFSK